MSINGTVVVDNFEIWTVVRKSSDDDEETKIAFMDENSARLDQKVYGGRLFVHTCFVTEGTEVPEGSTEDLRV